MGDFGYKVAKEKFKKKHYKKKIELRIKLLDMKYNFKINVLFLIL